MVVYTALHTVGLYSLVKVFMFYRLDRGIASILFIDYCLFDPHAYHAIGLRGAVRAARCVRYSAETRETRESCLIQ